MIVLLAALLAVVLVTLVISRPKEPPEALEFDEDCLDPIPTEVIIENRQNQPEEDWNLLARRLKFRFKFVDRAIRSVFINGTLVRITVSSYNIGDLSTLLRVRVDKGAGFFDLIEYDIIFEGDSTANPLTEQFKTLQLTTYNTFGSFPTTEEFCEKLVNPLLTGAKHVTFYE